MSHHATMSHRDALPHHVACELDSSEQQVFSTPVYLWKQIDKMGMRATRAML